MEGTTLLVGFKRIFSEGTSETSIVKLLGPGRLVVGDPGRDAYFKSVRYYSNRHLEVHMGGTFYCRKTRTEYRIEVTKVVLKAARSQ